MSLRIMIGFLIYSVPRDVTNVTCCVMPLKCHDFNLDYQNIERRKWVGKIILRKHDCNTFEKHAALLYSATDYNTL